MSLDGRLVLVGGGLFAREVICWIAQTRATVSLPARMGFIDRAASILDSARYGVEFFGVIEDFLPEAGDKFVMAISDPSIKRRIAELLRMRGASFVTIVHPTAVIASTAIIEEGAVICPLALVSADGYVDQLVAINTMSSVGHDVHVGGYATISAHVDLMGAAKIGECVFIGSGARVLPKVKVGPSAKIGAGAIIMRNVPEGVTMYAAPARRL